MSEGYTSIYIPLWREVDSDYYVKGIMPDGIEYRFCTKNDIEEYCFIGHKYNSLAFNCTLEVVEMTENRLIVWVEPVK